MAIFTFLTPVFFLEKYPRAVLIFIMIYVFLWFLRAIEFGFFLVWSFFQYRKALRKNWKKVAEKVDKTADLKTSEMIHLIFLPTYKEEIEVLRSSIGSIVNSNFDLKRVFLCLATEERDRVRGRRNAEILKAEFGEKFGRFFWVEHPKNLKNEIVGKGANISFAAKK